MLNTFGLRKEEIVRFKSFYQEVTANFNVQVIDDLNIPLEKFELFKHYHHIGHRQSVKIKEEFGKAYLAIVQVEYTSKGARGGSYSQLEFQIWGFVSLPKDFGHVFIKQETFTDKLLELFNKLEIDLASDTEFSDQFYVLSKDRQKAEQLLNEKFRDALKQASLKRFQLEVLGEWLVVSENKTMENSDVNGIGKLVARIAAIHF